MQKKQMIYLFKKNINMAKIAECYDVDLEKQYQQYLKLINLDEKDMHPEQQVQTKQAFYGAAGRILWLLRDVIASKTEYQSRKDLEGLWNQMQVYWQQRMQKPNKN
jgi:hypothetical protein